MEEWKQLRPISKRDFDGGNGSDHASGGVAHKFSE